MKRKYRVHQKDSFNLLETETFGLFYRGISNIGDSFFTKDRYSGMYPSEIMDLILGNQAPARPRVKILW